MSEETKEGWFRRTLMSEEGFVNYFSRVIDWITQ